KIPAKAIMPLGGGSEIPPAITDAPNIQIAAAHKATLAVKAKPAPPRDSQGASGDILGYSLSSPMTLAANAIIPGIAAHSIESCKSESTLTQRTITLIAKKPPATKNISECHCLNFLRSKFVSSIYLSSYLF